MPVLSIATLQCAWLWLHQYIWICPELIPDTDVKRYRMVHIHSTKLPYSLKIGWSHADCTLGILSACANSQTLPKLAWEDASRQGQHMAESHVAAFNQAPATGTICWSCVIYQYRGGLCESGLSLPRAKVFRWDLCSQISRTSLKTALAFNALFSVGSFVILLPSFY